MLRGAVKAKHLTVLRKPSLLVLNTAHKHPAPSGMLAGLASLGLPDGSGWLGPQTVLSAMLLWSLVL